jgi:hypothetical protein
MPTVYGLIEAPTPEETVTLEYEYYVESHTVWAPDLNEYVLIVAKPATAVATGLQATRT